MTLLAYNLTNTVRIITETTPPVTLPVSLSPPLRGPAVNVTSEFQALTALELLNIQRKYLGLVDIGWIGDAEDFIQQFPLMAPLERRLQEWSTKTQMARTNDLRIRGHQAGIACLSDGMSGDMEIALSIASPLSVLASLLNEQGAGSAKQALSVTLRNAAKVTHLWANFALVVQTAENAADPLISAPTLDPVTPTLKQGIVQFQIIYDTDAGATKVYVPGDSVSVTVKVSAADTLLGFTVASKTLTINVV